MGDETCGVGLDCDVRCVRVSYKDIHIFFESACVSVMRGLCGGGEVGGDLL